MGGVGGMLGGGGEVSVLETQSVGRRRTLL